MLRKQLIRAVLLGSMVATLMQFTAYANEVNIIDPFNLDEVTVIDELPNKAVDSITIIDEEYDVDSDSVIVLKSLLNEDVKEIVEEVSKMEEELRNQELIKEAEENYTYMGKFRLTSYCGCRRCNGKWTGYPTASGTDYVVGRTIAVDKRVIPLGSWVEINVPGQGWQRFRAEDTGSAIKGNDIDVYVGMNHSDCYQPQYNCYAEVRLVNEV